MTTDSQALKVPALFLCLFLLVACAPAGPPPKGTAPASNNLPPAIMAPPQVATSQKAGDGVVKDFAGGETVQKGMRELTVKETIKNLLDRHIKDIELHDALALSGNLTRDDLLVFQNLFDFLFYSDRLSQVAGLVYVFAQIV